MRVVQMIDRTKKAISYELVYAKAAKYPQGIINTNAYVNTRNAYNMMHEMLGYIPEAIQGLPPVTTNSQRRR